MPKRYLGNIITDTPSTPANNYQDTPASGVWGIYEVADLVKAGLWPTLGNINPSAFVENIFSTYLYEGTATSVSHQIQNGIDLAGEGGLVWIKKRDSNVADTNSYLSDTERGNYYLASNSVNAQASGDIASYNSDGWTFNASTGLGTDYNGSDYASWTFRKAPKFFDVVTYTGTGSGGLVVNHNLGATPGMILVKKTSDTGYWRVWHTATGNAYGNLNVTSSFFTGAQTIWGDGSSYVAPTNTSFTVGTDHNVNSSGQTYVAYLFAHNNGDGEFGLTKDQDIIKCGSYTGNGSTTGPEINLGFEPQWLLFKDTTNANDWIIIDNMRGMVVDNDLANADAYLRPNLSNQEGASTFVEPTPTGFKVQNNGWTNVSGANIIYIAIRRGPMAVPTAATDVFDITTHNATVAPAFKSDFPVDFALINNVTAVTSFEAASRLTQGKSLTTSSTAAETSDASYLFDYQDGWRNTTGTYSSLYSWMWKRAPNFFDVVAYTGSGTSGYATISHNLGVVPEMVWFKNRSSSATPRGNWYVYHKDLVNSGGYVYLNNTSAEATDYSGWASSTFAPSATGFTVLKNTLHYTNENYIAYFFASVDGVSKVGSFTGNGSSTGDSQDIDCGFSSGARFVLVKAIGAAGAWFLFDTERGIVAGNDSHLSLNSDAAEDTSRDLIDPLNSGFTINYHSDWGNQLNGNGQTYIFYAIA
jgi:hypothetical protein